jgi:isoleucyl-tRNA synthetase
VVNVQGETVALDLEITPKLRRAGLAREVIRLIQETRKNNGFDVSDRVALTWKADGETAAAIAEHRDLIAGEVLATTMAEAESVDTLAVRDDELGFAFTVFRG